MIAMQLLPLVVKYAVKLDNVILPLDQVMFYKSLITSGFAGVRTGQTTPDGLIVTETGDIARKGNAIVRLNESRMVIGVDGTKKQEVLDVFKEVSAILSKSDVELDKHAKFFELLAEYFVESDKNPALSIQNFVSPLELEQFDKVMENKCTLFNVRIVPKDVAIDSAEYYEINVEPRIPRPSKAYFVNVVYRSKDSKKTEKFTSLLDAKIESIIKAIEQSQPEK